MEPETTMNERLGCAAFAVSLVFSIALIVAVLAIVAVVSAAAWASGTGIAWIISAMIATIA